MQLCTVREDNTLNLLCLIKFKCINFTKFISPREISSLLILYAIKRLVISHDFYSGKYRSPFHLHPPWQLMHKFENLQSIKVAIKIKKMKWKEEEEKIIPRTKALCLCFFFFFLPEVIHNSQARARKWKVVGDSRFWAKYSKLFWLFRYSKTSASPRNYACAMVP